MGIKNFKFSINPKTKQLNFKHYRILLWRSTNYTFSLWRRNFLSHEWTLDFSPAISFCSSFWTASLDQLLLFNVRMLDYSTFSVMIPDQKHETIVLMLKKILVLFLMCHLTLRKSLCCEADRGSKFTAITGRSFSRTRIRLCCKLMDTMLNKCFILFFT